MALGHKRRLHRAGGELGGADVVEEAVEVVRVVEPAIGQRDPPPRLRASPRALGHLAGPRLVEVHPNDFITWRLPYEFCDAMAGRDADLSEVICQGEADLAWSDGTSTERVRVHLVSPNFFSSLGVHAYLGRVLGMEDERTAAMNAVLSYGFWQRRYQGDTSILGRRAGSRSRSSEYRRRLSTA